MEGEAPHEPGGLGGVEPPNINLFLDSSKFQTNSLRMSTKSTIFKKLRIATKKSSRSKKSVSEHSASFRKKNKFQTILRNLNDHISKNKISKNRKIDFSFVSDISELFGKTSTLFLKGGRGGLQVVE